jgi:glycine betaine/proline transport system substrate-binding protein
MPYTAVPAGSEGALVAELESAAAANKPLVMMFWAPHYALAAVEVGWVKMPPCKSQEEAHCIKPPDVAKIVWSGFAQKWPAAYEFLKSFKMNAEEQQVMMLRVDKKGEKLEDVAREWVEKNEQVWKPWVDAAKG